MAAGGRVDALGAAWRAEAGALKMEETVLA